MTATLEMSALRYWIAVLAAGAMGGVILWGGLSQGGAGGFVAAVAAALVWTLVGRMILLGRRGLVLADGCLSDTSGTEICRIAAIESVESGLFAIRPSNGFVIRLTEPGETAWVPGLWWRYGRRIGIGGATQPAATRALADQLRGEMAGLES